MALYPQEPIVESTTLVDASGKNVASISTEGEVAIDFVANSEHTDLFSKVRISSPSPLFTSQFLYDKRSLFWDESLATGGTSTFNSNTSSVDMAVTTSSGSSVIRQTKEYFAYEPGRAEQVAFTLTFGTATINCYQRIGIYDANDGLFVQLNGATFGIGIRTSTSGSPIDAITTQTNFNLDKLDGTGPSGLILDVTKSQLFFIEYQWFGVGSIRYGIYGNGQINYFHRIDNSNINVGPYMKRGSLPIRYEITNTGVTANAVTLHQICSCVQAEAGYNPTGVKLAEDTGPAGRTIAGSATLPMISIRLKAANIRGSIIPQAFSVLGAAANNFFYQIILNGTLTGASFNSVNSNSITEFDIAATAISGGTILSSGYLSSAVRQDVSTDIDSLLKVVSNIAGTPDVLSLVITSISGGSATFYGSLEWLEYV